MALNHDSAHRRLEQVNLITSLGDYLSLFAVISATHRMSGSVALAAYTVPLSALAVGLGGATFPWVAGMFRARAVMIGTQLTSGLLMLLLGGFIHFEAPLPAIFAVIFFQTISNQYFAATRESYSKNVGAHSDQRSLQSKLMQGFYSAQFVGPLISLVLIRTLGEEIPILGDALSFFVAAALCFGLPEGTKPDRPSIFRPLTYVWKRPALLQIFVIRSVLYWIPTGIFNYMVFSVVSQRFGLRVIDTAWTYAAIGLGSLFGSTWLRHTKKIVEARGPLAALARLSDAHVAFLALLALSVTRLSFMYVPNVYIALLIITAGGVCNGFNAVATQTIRRKLTNDREFPEIVGLELVLGRATDWIVATICLGGLYGAKLSYEQGIWISAGGLFVLAWLHLGRGLRGV